MSKIQEILNEIYEKLDAREAEVRPYDKVLQSAGFTPVDNQTVTEKIVCAKFVEEMRNVIVISNGIV